MHTTPISLLARLRQPDAGEAWDRFVKLYTPFLVALLVTRFQVRTQDVSDLVQDIFVGLVRTLPNFEYDGQHSFRGYLRRVCHNKVIDFRRKQLGEAVEDAGSVRPGRCAGSGAARSSVGKGSQAIPGTAGPRTDAGGVPAGHLEGVLASCR